eukprot:10675454-Alexandrium_andersonii.AAC.1
MHEVEAKYNELQGIVSPGISGSVQDGKHSMGDCSYAVRTLAMNDEYMHCAANCIRSDMAKFDGLKGEFYTCEGSTEHHWEEAERAERLNK